MPPLSLCASSPPAPLCVTLTGHAPSHCTALLTCSSLLGISFHDSIISFLTWLDAIHVIPATILLYQGEQLWHSKPVDHYFPLKYPKISLPSLWYPEVPSDSYLNCRFNIYLFNSLIIQPKLQQKSKTVSSRSQLLFLAQKWLANYFLISKWTNTAAITRNFDVEKFPHHPLQAIKLHDLLHEFWHQPQFY